MTAADPVADRVARDRLSGHAEGLAVLVLVGVAVGPMLTHVAAPELCSGGVEHGPLEHYSWGSWPRVVALVTALLLWRRHRWALPAGVVWALASVGVAVWNIVISARSEAGLTGLDLGLQALGVGLGLGVLGVVVLLHRRGALR